MKRTLLLILILFSSVLGLKAQNDLDDDDYPEQRPRYRRPRVHERYTIKSIRYGLFFIAGFAEGVNDAISFHYPAFKRVHPGANDLYWNPEVSWKNKYTNWDAGDNSPRYWQSTQVLVWTTDAFHMTNMVDHITMLSGASIMIPLNGQKRRWTWYAKEIFMSYMANRAGFYLSYNIIYKSKP